MPRNPKTTFTILTPATLAAVTDHKVLILGQMISGTATAGALVKEIGNLGEEDALFGATSHVAKMIREFKRINKDTQVDAIAIADAGGATDGTAVAAVTGTATASGSIVINVGSGFQNTYSIDITSGDAATAIGDAIAAAITADTKAPFTAANVTGTVTITAANGGTLSNDYAIQVVGEVAGVSVALTGWTGGATDPTLTGVFDVVGDTRYQTIVWPSAWAIADAQTFIDARFNVTNDVRDGVVCVHINDTLANLKIASQVVTNTESIRVGGTQVIDSATLKGGSIVELDDVLAARFAAVRSLRLTADTNINAIMSVVGAPRDNFGGSHISTIPYFNTLIQFTAIPDRGDMFSNTEEAELEAAGVSTIGLNDADNAIILGNQVTTYLTDTGGNPDSTWHFLNAVDSSVAIREFFFLNNKIRYAQSRLTDGDLLAGFAMANEQSIRTFQKSLYNALSELAITQAGIAAAQDFEDNIVVVVDVATGQATIDPAPLQVGQLRVIVGTITVNFGG